MPTGSYLRCRLTFKLKIITIIYQITVSLNIYQITVSLFGQTFLPFINTDILFSADVIIKRKFLTHKWVIIYQRFVVNPIINIKYHCSNLSMLVSIGNEQDAIYQT